MDISLGKLWEIVKDREAWYASVHHFAKSLTLQKVRQDLAMNINMVVLFLVF